MVDFLYNQHTICKAFFDKSENFSALPLVTLQDRLTIYEEFYLLPVLHFPYYQNNP